ncbi:MAG: hypothetical protein N4J56_002509 [Chroococcidiopsis sp. SAG 2025]|uniref:hypothetical protein n=1 Tax=Chroococcidiopsis sp. SAG 2025 TaxID=171389 RepID=UPI00293728AE|nr:hypothetical protein [Chroococcidiopsis sp. SAG 2025]MDV2992855.1 hypothetical protein [Chroococcidiopsis sp. SAG 2025]
MEVQESQLDAKHLIAAQMYALGHSNLEIGNELGYSQETIRKWAIGKEFKAEVRRIRERSVEETVGVLTSVGKKSAHILLEMLNRDNLSDREKLTAIKLGLEFLFKGFDTFNVVVEIAELKEMLRRATDGNASTDI